VRRRGAGVLLLTCVLLPLGGCESQEWRGGVEVGEAAPAYAAETLQGDSLALRDLRGEVVLLNVWASWCAPCRHEMPLLEELHRRYGPDGLRIVGASVDSRSARGQVERFLSQEEITYTILLDPREDVTRAFRTVGVPESFLLDREGRLVWQFRGLFDPLDARFLERIERLLTSS
jgi:thiol-disulfide isomerase/thioredoxin